MPRVIFKCPYLKGGSERTTSHLQNYVRYIATREGAQRIVPWYEQFPATEKQREMVAQLLREFPLSRGLFEYEDYQTAPTRGNASEFITRALEDNYDQIAKRDNYVSYIASRPRAQRTGAHALFTGSDDPLVLSNIADEVAHHPGNVWLPIISLRREDAARLGYDDAGQWKNLIAGYAMEMAEAMKIPWEQFRWYAAFHDQGHHPHVHMVCYSADGRSGFLTREGIAQIKSDLAQRIFRQELYELYERQTQRRDELTQEAGTVMDQLVFQMREGTLENPKIEQLMEHLAGKLKNLSGKKQYGYLKAPLKSVVDEIVDELAKDERIAELYSLWYEQRENIVRTYQDTMPKRIPLSQNKEFKTINNAVIQEALNILHNRITFEDETFEQEDRVTDEEPEVKAYKNPWTDPEDMRCQYIMGKKYLNEESEDFDPEEAIRWFEKSATQGFDIAMYKLGKLYLQGEYIDKDVNRALYWLYKADEANNQYAQYLLGKIYLNGSDVPLNYKVAEEMFSKASAQGSSYAKYSLAKMHLKGQTSFSSIAIAVQLLTEAAEQGNQWAEYQLGKMYLYGQGVDKNYELAVRLLTSSANRGNEYAERLLENYHAHTPYSSPTILASLRLLARLSQIIRDDADKRDKSGRAIDRKLARKIEQKKEAHGQKMG